MELILQGKQSKELAPGAVLQHEVQLMLILEALLEFDQEGMV